MRILFIAFHYTEYSLGLVKELAVNNDVVLVIPKSEEERVCSGAHSCQGEHPFKIVSICHRTMRDPRVLGNIYKLLKIASDFKPDVVHIQETPTIYLVVTVFFWTKIPIVLTVHDPFPHLGESSSKHHSWAETKLRERADAVIVHGRYLKQEMAKIIKDKNIFVIPHGCLDGFQVDEKEVLEEKNTILFFGRIHEYKGLKYLIDAIPSIKRKITDIRIIIAGQGADLDKYKESILNNSNCELHDSYIDNKLIPNYFLRSSVIVLPYVEATQSGIIPMAYAFGKPVVATAVGSLTEIVDDYRTGILVPPRDSEKLAEAVVYLLTHDSERKKMGQAALHEANTRLSCQNTAKLTVACYQETIKKRVD